MVKRRRVVIELLLLLVLLLLRRVLPLLLASARAQPQVLWSRPSLWNIEYLGRGRWAE